MRQKGTLILILTVLGAGSTIASPVSEAAHQIEKVLKIQADAWNEGDLDRFMETYWNSPDLTFFSGGKPLAGWGVTFQRYRQRYQKDGRDMGHLHFSNLKVVQLSDESGFVRGRFHLQRTGMDELTGLFTLVLKRFPEGWRIIHDHTSSGDR